MSLPHLGQRAAVAPGDLADYRQRLRLLGGRHHRDARLDDARLFARNQLYGVAQDLRVVKADGRDAADQGPQHVRRIQPAAQADLYHLRAQALRSEVVERHSRDQLEEGHAPVAFGYHPLQGGPKLLHQTRGKSSSATGSPPTRIRSRKVCMWGDENIPGLKPAGGQD